MWWAWELDRDTPCCWQGISNSKRAVSYGLEARSWCGRIPNRDSFLNPIVLSGHRALIRKCLVHPLWPLKKLCLGYLHHLFLTSLEKWSFVNSLASVRCYREPTGLCSLQWLVLRSFTGLASQLLVYQAWYQMPKDKCAIATPPSGRASYKSKVLNLHVHVKWQLQGASIATKNVGIQTQIFDTYR